MRRYRHTQYGDAVDGTQGFNRNADVVKRAKSGGAITPRVMKTGNRHERAAAAHTIGERGERGADHGRGGGVDAGEGWRIAAIEVAAADFGAVFGEGKVVGGMKPQELRIAGRDRRADGDATVEALL